MKSRKIGFAWLGFGAGLGLACYGGQMESRAVQVLAGSEVPGYADGLGTQARFSGSITGLDVDAVGNVYVADAGNLRVRKISPVGEVTTLAGTGKAGFADGPGAQAQFVSLATYWWPSVTNVNTLAVDCQGNCYVLDSGGNLERIRKISATGVVSTFYTEPTVTVEPGWPTPPTFIHRLKAIAIRSGVEVVVNREVFSIGAPSFLHSIEAIAPDGTRSALLSLRPASQSHSLKFLASGGSSNVYFIADTWPLWRLSVVSPLSGGGDLVSYSFSGDGKYGAVAANAASTVCFGYCSSVSGQWVIRRCGANGGIDSVQQVSWPVTELAVDEAENLYLAQGAQIVKVAHYGLMLTALVDGGGSIGVNPSGPYLSNTVVQVTATPLSGWTFQGWSGEAQGTATNLTLTMDAHKTVKATFAAPLSVTPSAGGTVSREPDLALYAYGTQVTLTARPDTGFEFIRWSDGVGGSTRTVSVTSRISLEPVFAALPQFTLSASVLGGVGGTVERKPDQALYYRDTVVKLTARPAAGYVFQTWLDNVQANPRTVVMTSNVTLFAVFAPGQPQPPTITTGPPDATVVVGGQVQFSVVAQGSTPLEYQWQKNGVDIPGALEPSWVLASAQLGDAGAYAVVVSNPAGSVTSRAATLVMVRPEETYQGLVLSDGPVSYWRLGERSGQVATDLAGGHNGTYVNGVLLGQSGALAADPDTAAGFVQASWTRVEVPYSAHLNAVQFSLECWAMPTGADDTFRPVLASRDDSPTRGFILQAQENNRWHFTLGMGAPGWGGVVGPPVRAGVWTYLAMTYDGTTERAYVNGVEVGSANISYAPNTGQPLRIGAGGDATADLFFEGRLDEVAIYSKVLSAAQIRAHYAMATPCRLHLTRALELSLVTAPGLSWQVQWSGDLRSWTNLAVVTGGGTPVLVRDPDAGQAVRFYRAVKP
jgi:hypothetical protein